MNFNDLLKKHEIDPKEVLVLRHRPKERKLNRVLPRLAAEKPDLFNAYQQTQTEKVERVMKSLRYVASFIGHEPGKALFVGLYSIGKWRPLTRQQFWRIRAHIELKAFDMTGFSEQNPRPSMLWFELSPEPFYSKWKGKLVVSWPPPELSWWRRSHKNDIPVIAILEDSALDAAMPEWDRLVINWQEMSVLPKRWKEKLSGWRAIYYIFDTSDRKGYVGSAYGPNNLLGRWEHYASSGHGGNALLRRRDPNSFRFTILELVSPAMKAKDVIRVEAKWKDRLHSREPYGLNEN
jgi:hypothetical protein